MLTSKPIIIAHRGLHSLHPENSLAAFKAAWSAGIQWCECDVQFTSDSVPIVLHDPTLERTTSLTGPVADCQWNDLKNGRLIDPSGRATKQKIPSLESLIRSIPRGCGLLVEIKPEIRDGESLSNLLKTNRQIVAQSFNPQNLRILHSLNPHLPLALLVGNKKQLSAALKGPWQSIHLNQELLTCDVFNGLRNSEKKVGVWTVNEPRKIARFLRWGVTALITDKPVEASLLLSD